MLALCLFVIDFISTSACVICE